MASLAFSVLDCLAAAGRSEHLHCKNHNVHYIMKQNRFLFTMPVNFSNNKIQHYNYYCTIFGFSISKPNGFAANIIPTSATAYTHYVCDSVPEGSSKKFYEFLVCNLLVCYCMSDSLTVILRTLYNFNH